MEALQKYLTDNKIKRSEFARLCGVTPGRITQLIQGKGDPSMELVRAMIKASNGNLKAEDLVSGEACK